METLPSISALNINADRFVPRNKQGQWDSVPQCLIVSPPTINLSDCNVLQRRSQFDKSFFNRIHYVAEHINTLAYCTKHQVSCMFLPFLVRHSEFWFFMQANLAHIENNRRNIRRIQTLMEEYASKSSSNGQDRGVLSLGRRGSDYSYDENRVIETNAEALAKLCDYVTSLVQVGPETNEFHKKMKTFPAYIHRVVHDYCTRITMIMDMERLQASKDITTYDLYSKKFDFIEIPMGARKESCPGCMKEGFRSDKYFGQTYCFYHYNLSLSPLFRDNHSFSLLEKKQGLKKPSIVSSEVQFRALGQAFTWGQSKLIGYLTVTGVAENRPLITIGDFLRLRFMQTEEVIAEVINVDIKSERIMLSLPIKGHYSTCPAYFSALTCPSNCQRYVPESEQSRYHQSGRFDVRFGLFGHKAHDIFRQTLAYAAPEQVVRITAPTLLLSGIQLKSNRRLQIGISEWSNPDINMEQRHAVYDIVRKNHGPAPYIIDGPAGTGKTMTVVESIVQVLRWNGASKILVCAASDAACDVLATRLLSALPKTTKLLRVNYNCRNPDSLPPNLLAVSTMNESGLFTLPTVSEMKNSSVVVCQCFVAGMLDSNTPYNSDSNWMRHHFTHVFIDESSQSFEFESMIPLLKVGLDCSIVLAGDPKQLGPTVRSPIASRNGLSLSLQERLLGLKLYSDHGASRQSYAVITKLLDNYRSHDALLRIPSELFYGGSLRCKGSNKKTSACQNFELLRDGERFPLLAYDVVDGKEMSKIDTPSFYNIEECEAISRIIQALLSSPNVHLHSGDVGVITCFRAQVLKLREILRKDGMHGINVGLVEDFQGQEKSVVLISTVLTNSNNRWQSDSGGLGFMTDPKKFNVAITRASSFCAIVGKVDYLEQSGSYWSALIEHVRKNGGISSSSVRNNSSKLDQSEVYNDYEDYDYGISEFIKHVEDLNLLGSGHELDRYDLAMRGYYEDAPEWKVCL